MKYLNLAAKSLLTIAVLAMSGITAAQVTAQKNIAVTASLTSQCRVATSSAGAVTLAFGAYTAFQTSGLAATQQAVDFECTRGRTGPPTFAWDNSFGTTTGEGIIAGLRYSLTASNGVSAAGSAPALATAGDIGTADAYRVLIDGSILANQAGTETSGTASVTRTLTVSF